MPLGKEEAHGAGGEHHIIAGDAVEHHHAHHLAALQKAAEHQQECRLDGAHAGHIGQGVGQKQHQAGEQLHLQKAQRGKPHEPDAQVGQAEQPEQLDRLQCQNFSAAGLICQQAAALLAQNIQLLLPIGAALLPFFRFGQQTHQPAGKVLHQRRYAHQHQHHNDGRHYSVCHGQIIHHTGGVGGKPSVLKQQHHRGIQQHGGFVEHVLQGHQAHARANRQAAAVQIPCLHRHCTCAQRDHIAKGAAPRGIDALPEPEARDAAAHDAPRHAPLQQRVAEADGQHHQHLPCGQLRKRCGDLGPVVLEQQHDDAGKCGEHQQRDHCLFAGRCGRGGLAHRENRLLSGGMI